MSHNRLRNLDKFLAFLSTKFAFLHELDLFGNPLAEEPDYRLKIIHAMPQIKLLDRHAITVEERIKAEKIFGKEAVGATKKGSTANNSGKGAGGSRFSLGEKDLYREVGTLRKLEEQKRQDEELARATYYKQRTY